MVNVRVFFKKKGVIRYISHLDLQRAIIRALLRSGLDVVYTNGFNPRPKIVFAQPLSVFHESEYEIFDIKINEDTPKEEVFKKLVSVMPKGIEVFSVNEPILKLSDCNSARYKLTFMTKKNISDIERALCGEITVLKKTKSNQDYCDISPMITDKIFYEQDKDVVLEATLSAGAEYLNPNCIAIFLKDNNLIDDYRVLRLCLLNKAGKPLK